MGSGTRPVHTIIKKGGFDALPGLLNYSSLDQEDLAASSSGGGGGGGPSPAQIERYLGGRGGGKRHTIAGPPQPDSPRRRRTGLMTVMEKPPNIPADLVQVCLRWTK